jgi:hypothetical protein
VFQIHQTFFLGRELGGREPSGSRESPEIQGRPVRSRREREEGAVSGEGGNGEEGT